MKSLLIDYKKIVNPVGMKNLCNKLKKPPVLNSSSSILGLILIIPETQLSKLKKRKSGISRVNYINNKDFTGDIEAHAYVVYDHKKKLCEIIGLTNDKYLYLVLNSVLTGIPNDVTLWIGTELTNPKLTKKINTYVHNGFDNPHICSSSPLGTKFLDKHLCMFKINYLTTEKIQSYEVLDVVKNFFSTNNCKLTTSLSQNTVKHFKKFTHIGSTMNPNGSISQKELSGRMERYNKLEVDENSIIHGEEQGVMMVDGLYNFHSHPSEAYEKNNVKLAPPSAQDYYGFLMNALDRGTILHIVVSLEGLYILSLTDYWITKKYLINEEEARKFILENYKCCYTKGQTIKWYIDNANSIVYKNEEPLFLVQYLSWKNATDKFTVAYSKSMNSNCFCTQKTIDVYNEVY